jgi:hypothetical protein
LTEKAAGVGEETATVSSAQGPRLDSLQREAEDDETRLLVVVARFGAVGDGGSTVSGGGAVGVSPVCLQRKKKGKGRRRREGRMEERLGFLGPKDKGREGAGERGRTTATTHMACLLCWERR